MTSASRLSENCTPFFTCRSFSEDRTMEKIETERLVLRNFWKDDAVGLFEYLHKPAASCFLSLALKDMSEAEAEAEKRGGDDGHIAVCLKGSDRLIGDLFAVQEEDTFSV